MENIKERVNKIIERNKKEIQRSKGMLEISYIDNELKSFYKTKIHEREMAIRDLETILIMLGDK